MATSILEYTLRKHAWRHDPLLAPLPHTTTRCNALQRTATHRNTLQHTVTHKHMAAYSSAATIPHSTATCAWLRTCRTHTSQCCVGASRFIPQQHTTNALQHAATRCNTLQHTHGDMFVARSISLFSDVSIVVLNALEQTATTSNN